MRYRRFYKSPICFHGTEFQIRVWNELRNIPFGKTISYKAQAEKVGNFARAVGLANGRNPISIIVPCHRVIGADGRLVGYGGGLDRKRTLLQFEAMVRDFGPHPLVARKNHAALSTEELKTVCLDFLKTDS